MGCVSIYPGDEGRERGYWWCRWSVSGLVVMVLYLVLVLMSVSMVVVVLMFGGVVGVVVLVLVVLVFRDRMVWLSRLPPPSSLPL